MNVFPPVIDNTMISSYRNCPTSFNLGYLQHYKISSGKSVHLVAGGAFAKGVEMARRAFYIEGLSQQDAEAEGLIGLVKAYGDFEPPDDSAKSLERMCGALEFYFENYPLATDIARVAKLGPTYATEFSFATPLPLKHPVTGNPLIFAGKADAVVEYAGGLYVMDEKTSTSLGAQWAKQWDLKSQFAGYAWALRELGYRPAGAIVRGVSILKTKYETQQVIVGQENWKIERWYEQTLLTVQDMLDSYSSGKWRYNLGESCGHFGGCQYKMACLAPDPQPWLDTYFTKSEWHPLENH